MIGVILWRDVAHGKAVVWCEDQGDLAFFNDAQQKPGRNEDLEVGDVVRFDVNVDSNLRVATNVSKLLENWGSLLQDALARLPDEPDGVSDGDGAKIVPIRAFGPSKRREYSEEVPRRRHG